MVMACWCSCSANGASVRQEVMIPDFLGWRFESLLVSAEKYWWRNLLQFAFHLVILLELAVFLDWRFEGSLVRVEKYC